MPRHSSPVGDLARLGFALPERAAALAAQLGDELVHACAGSADPDAALLGLDNLRRADPDALDRLAAAPALLARVVAVLGASDALGAHLARYPEDVAACAPGLSDADASLGPVATPDELRRSYRRALLGIAADDLAAADPRAELDVVARRLADLADQAMAAALALARAEVGDGPRLAVVAMGKCGARELNYVSDVDVIFVAEPRPDRDAGAELTLATKVAAAATRILSGHSAAGSIWAVDAGLRPEGNAGPLVRTLDGMRAYYTSWAKPWEFQALLKARPMAGDAEVGRAFVDLVAPLVWRVGDQPEFVPEVQAMRRRVVSLLPAREAAREIKLGAGGLRDVEFTVQLLQLIHGRADDRLRAAATLPALAALVDHGYVGRADGARLADSYRALRLLEHRIQLIKLRRTHLLPEDPAMLARLGRELGQDPAELWRSTSRRVLRLHQRLFYSPLLAAVARIKSSEIGLTPEQAQTRLRALGYADPRAALRHVGALTAGLTRRAEIHRQLLPAMLGWLAEAPSPDAGLLAFRQVSEDLGDHPWYLRALRDEGAMAERLARVLASGRYATDLLRRDPQAVAFLADAAALAPRSRAEIHAEMAAAAERADGPDAAVAAIRVVRTRELLRSACRDLLAEPDVEVTGRALTDLTGATLDAALAAVAPGVGLGVVALGRWGSGELGYASDADALFIVAEDADVEAATRAVARLRRLLSAPSGDPALGLDADLRPEGRNGALVRPLAAYRAYYERWSSPWEAQALLRAAPGAGSADLADALLALVSPLRWPDSGPTAAAVAEMRRLKARMEAERLPRGADPARHLKLGPGGLSDVEWTVQLLQLRHAAEHPELRATGTLAALRAALAADLVERDDAADLETAWLLASRLRNAAMLVRGRPTDQLPTDARELAATAMLLGYGRGEASMLVDDYRRAARRARRVVERLFFGS